MIQVMDYNFLNLNGCYVIWYKLFYKLYPLSLFANTPFKDTLEVCKMSKIVQPIKQFDKIWLIILLHLHIRHCMLALSSISYLNPY